VTLRFRLTAALVVLVAVGLLAADVATYAAFRSFLVKRVDQQLASAQSMLPGLLSNPDLGNGQTPSGDEPDPFLPSGTFVALYDASGKQVRARTISYDASAPSPPAITAAVLDAAGPGAAPRTVGAVGGGGSTYRVLASQLRDTVSGDMYTAVLGIPLTEVGQTLRRLEVVAAIVTLAVLAAMALLSWWTVRRGLRPLEEIEHTAGAIAAGDLSRRVGVVDPRTEVGRLGGALNVMLGRIEDAMDEQRASEEALRRFLADASHELRTPLTSIRGYAELFRRGARDDPEDTALAMRRIEQESQRMGVLVDDLLFLARSGHGRPIEHDPVDLARVAADAVHDAIAVDPSRAIALEAPPTLTIAGDEARLRQVLANLLGNAIAHTPAGTPVTVGLRNGGGWAELSVADSGPGLTTEETARVFDAFYRVDPARKRTGSGEGRGTGLGLAIVAAIAEAHGGTASVESSPGRGATFTVRLPVDAPDTPTIPPAPPTPPAPAPPPPTPPAPQTEPGA
jgi:two-component system OmpR family sensor kinase